MPRATNYAGIPIVRNTVLAIAIGAAFAGLGGVEVMGVYGKMAVPFVSNGIGVALLGHNHPFGVVLGALVFGGLFSGAQEMQFGGHGRGQRDAHALLRGGTIGDARGPGWGIPFDEPPLRLHRGHDERPRFY